MKRPRKPPRPARGKSAPTGIGQILKGLRRSSKLGLQLEQAKIWEHWEALAGPRLSRHGRPRSIKDGRLVVDVDTPVSMHRFTYRKFAIMRRINALAKRELVSDIFFQLAPDEDMTPPVDRG